MDSKEIASAWGKKHGFDRFMEISQEESGTVYYMFHSVQPNGKNGLPQFIRILKNGKFNDSFDWPYEEINKYIAILRTLKTYE